MMLCGNPPVDSIFENVISPISNEIPVSYHSAFFIEMLDIRFDNLFDYAWDVIRENQLLYLNKKLYFKYIIDVFNTGQIYHVTEINILYFKCWI